MPQLKLKSLLVFLIVGLLTITVSFIPNLVSDELKPWLLQNLGASYPQYLIGFFVVACFILLALTDEFKGLLSFTKNKKPIKIAWSKDTKERLKLAREKLQTAKPEECISILSGLNNVSVEEQLSLLSARLAQYRQDSGIGILSNEQKETIPSQINKALYSLIKAVENQLAEGEKENRKLRDAFRQRYRDRLAKKLVSRQPVNLRRFATTEGTSERVAATFIPYNSEEIREEIGKTFQEARGRLLILGQPGAGKTTLLLQLADRLFDLEEDALPVVLNLATWQSSFGKLETWLEMILAAELGTNKAGAKIVLRQANLILLLDGLDELKEDEAINSCLAAIADFGAVAGRRFVITCRIEEYKRVQEDARVNLQIEVGPLQGEQLEAELNHMGHEQPEARALLQAIQKDPLLREAVENPFYFNTLQLLFAGRLPVFTSNDLESRKNEITQKFVEAALQSAQQKAYPLALAEHWLSFLASRMNERNMVGFELRDLQFNWWQGWTARNLKIGHLLEASSPRLVIQVSSKKNVSLRIDNRKNVLPDIYTRDFFQWSSVTYRKLFKKKLIIWLLFGLLFGLFYGLIGLLFGLFYDLFFGRIVLIVLTGLFFGLLVGIIVLPLYILIKNESSNFILIKTPYQRFYASMKLFHFSIVQHWHLRYLLYKKGALPLDLVNFLNEMTARSLLETDGATWRFRHRIIQDYFAAQWQEKQ